ncbi:MAG: LysR family transcriptional regulator [Alphaproteobacteria bacterium]|nr:LysR family transcriptional regulator [Alphaproteobacteria bacterium]
MNLTLLSTLVAVIDRGSFAAAAPEIGCTPSAVSLQMKQLEAWFGRPLFDRSARTVRPTPFALEAASVARDVGSRVEALRTRSTITVSGRVRLGAIATVQSGALPQALRTLRDRHPALDVEVVLDDSDALLVALKAGRIDVAVLVRPSAGGSTRLAWHDLAKQPFVLLTPPGVEATTPTELLRRYTLIRYDTALTGGRIAAQYVRRVCPQARFAMEVRSIDAIVAMVAAGLGVSIVPQPRRALLEAHGVREVALGRSGPTRQIAAVRRRADIDSRNLNAAVAALASAYA